MQFIDINNEYQIAHDIIKETTKDMTLKQIQSYTTKEIENLVEILDQQRIPTTFNEKLWLEEGWILINNQNEHKSCESVLFENLMNLKYFPHKKGKKYSHNQISELSDLIRSYPNDLSVIRKSLNIPWSSFQRLTKEWEIYIQNNAEAKDKAYDHSHLNEAEQIYIAKLIKPPTYPTSVPQI